MSEPDKAYVYEIDRGAYWTEIVMWFAIGFVAGLAACGCSSFF